MIVKEIIGKTNAQIEKLLDDGLPSRVNNGFLQIKQPDRNPRQSNNLRMTRNAFNPMSSNKI
jgi:hypothetical protein